jgi:hypothetical protein
MIIMEKALPRKKSIVGRTNPRIQTLATTTERITKTTETIFPSKDISFQSLPLIFSLQVVMTQNLLRILNIATNRTRKAIKKPAE